MGPDRLHHFERRRGGAAGTVRHGRVWPRWPVLKPAGRGLPGQRRPLRLPCRASGGVAGRNLSDRLAVVKRIQWVMEVADLDVLKSPCRWPAARRYRRPRVRDPGGAEQPACRDAGGEVVNLAGAGRLLEAVQPKEAEHRLKCRLSGVMYAPGAKLNRLSTSKLRPALSPAPVPSILATPCEAVEIGDRVRFAGATEGTGETPRCPGRAAGYRRGSAAVTDSPRAERRARADAPRTEVPGGAQPCRRAPSCGSRMNASPDSVPVHDVVLGFLFRSSSAWER
jgi:hypothetical protein